MKNKDDYKRKKFIQILIKLNEQSKTKAEIRIKNHFESPTKPA